MPEQYKSTLQLLLPAPSPDSILPDALIATPVQQAAVAIASPEPVVPDALITVQVAPQTAAAPAPFSKANGAAGRAFRVKLRGSVLVLVRLPNKRLVRAAIHQLSTTGGVIHLEKPLDEKLEVEVIFHVREATIRNKAQMLFPMWATQGWMQPFRFVALPEESRETLDSKLKSFLGENTKAASAGA